jgi:hypothetical protein
MIKINVLLTTLAILLSVSFFVSAEEPGTSMIVTTEAGLRLRESADTTGKIIVTIPYKSVVQVLEEKGEPITISGKTGKWCRIAWKNKTGWAFGGFLVEVAGNGDVPFIKKCIIECSKTGNNDCTKISGNYKKYIDARKRISVNDQFAVDEMGFARAALKKSCPETVTGGLD